MARVYSGMPMEDFRYSPERGLFNFWALTPMCVVDGEAINRDQGGAQSENTKYWNDAYKQIRDINYFLETLPDYAANFQEADMQTWRGEMYFNRAFVYFALAKRYGTTVSKICALNGIKPTKILQIKERIRVK